MISKRIKTLLLFAGIIVVLALVIFTSRSSRWSSRQDTALSEHIQKRQQAEHELVLVKKEYEQTKAELAKKANTLRSELQKTQTDQKVLKAKYIHVRQELIHLASGEYTPSTEEAGVNEISPNCDSLKAVAIEYVSHADSTIENLEAQVSTLQEIVIVKDSAVAAAESISRDMEKRVEEMAEDGKKLEEMIRKNQKREKRRKFFRRVGAAGLLILTGVVTSIAIQSN